MVLLQVKSDYHAAMALSNLIELRLYIIAIQELPIIVTRGEKNSLGMDISRSTCNLTTGLSPVQLHVCSTYFNLSWLNPNLVSWLAIRKMQCQGKPSFLLKLMAGEEAMVLAFHVLIRYIHCVYCCLLHQVDSDNYFWFLVKIQSNFICLFQYRIVFSCCYIIASQLAQYLYTNFLSMPWFLMQTAPTSVKAEFSC